MHESSMKRMAWFANSFKEELVNGHILDVGSYNVNGCYRDIFGEIGIKYEGLDMEAGPNVDIVPNATYNWEEIENDSYDAVISGQALEHIEFFWLTMEEMIRVTKENGLICIIAPNGFGEHRYPVDCWRFFTDGMVALARYFQLEILHAHTNASPSFKDVNWYSDNCADSMLIARKKYKGRAKIVNLKTYRCVPADHEELMNGMVTYKSYIEEKEKEDKKNTRVQPDPAISQEAIRTENTDDAESRKGLSILKKWKSVLKRIWRRSKKK